MVLLIEDPFKKVFRNSSFWSKTLLFTSGLYIFIVLVPFFIGYIVDNFWKSSSTIFEQPIVNFQGDHLLHCLKKGGTEYISTSISLLDKQINDGPEKLLFKVKRVDANEDNKFEFFQIEMRQYFTTDYDQECSLYLITDVGLREKASLQMQSPVHFRYSRGSTKSVQITGDFVLEQKAPLVVSKQPMNHWNYTVPEPSKPVNQHHLDMMSFIRDANQRNVTLRADYKTSFIDMTATMTTSNYFTVFFLLRVPVLQEIKYVPSLKENLKQVWQYYVFIFIPVYWLLCYILEFALNNNIFKTSVYNTLPNQPNIHPR